MYSASEFLFIMRKYIILYYYNLFQMSKNNYFSVGAYCIAVVVLQK